MERADKECVPCATAASPDVESLEEAVQLLRDDLARDGYAMEAVDLVNGRDARNALVSLRLRLPPKGARESEVAAPAQPDRLQPLGNLSADSFLHDDSDREPAADATPAQIPAPQPSV